MDSDHTVNFFSPEMLRRTRRVRSIKQEWLAEQLNVSQGTISKWENGTSTPDPRHIARLFEVLALPNHHQTDHWLYRLVGDSRRQVHLMRESDHSLLAASDQRVTEWQREYAEVAARPLSSELPNDIESAERSLRELDYEVKWCCPVVLSIKGREDGPYRIERGLLLWEWFMLSDGELVRLITNIEPDEIPQKSLRFCL